VVPEISSQTDRQRQTCSPQYFSSAPAGEIISKTERSIRVAEMIPKKFKFWMNYGERINVDQITQNTWVLENMISRSGRTLYVVRRSPLVLIATYSGRKSHFKVNFIVARPD